MIHCYYTDSIQMNNVFDLFKVHVMVYTSQTQLPSTLTLYRCLHRMQEFHQYVSDRQAGNLIVILFTCWVFIHPSLPSVPLDYCKAIASLLLSCVKQA